MAGPGKTLTVYLAADISKFTRGMREADDVADTFGGRLRNSLGPALIAAGAAAGAFAAKLAVDAVQAAAAEEAELTKLNTTLENLGFAAASEQVNGFIDRLQFTSGVADSELRPAFDRLVRSTGDVNEAQRALSIALDTSRGTGKSLQSVADALGKAYDGNTTALGRLGIGIDRATLASGDLQAITGKMADTFAGQATKAAQTLQGRMDRLKIASDELIEAFGVGLVGASDDAGRSLEDTIDRMERARPQAQRLGSTINDLGLDLLEGANRFATLSDAVSKGAWTLVYEYVRALYAGQDAMDVVAMKVRSLGGQFQYLQYAAYGAAGGVLAATNAKRAQSAESSRWTEIAKAEGAQIAYNNAGLRDWKAGLEEAAKSTRSSGSAIEETNPKLERQTELIRNLVTRLSEEKTALDNAVAARKSYADSLASSILGNVSLRDVFDPADVEGSIQRFRDAISGASGFSDALAQLGISLPDSAGAQSFISQVLGLGTESGKAFLAGLTPEVAQNLVAELDKAITTVNGNSFLLADKFYGEGVQAAQESINGYIVQIGKEEKRLRQIGRNIGKPIGANIKAEIAQAVAEAVTAAEAAKSAAAAERAAQIAASQVTVTEQQVAKALQQLLVNADKRATGQVGVLR